MPNRVLLVYDDFKELTQTEGYLKKTGFDVLTAQNERSLLDHLLGFRPEVIVCSGSTPRVSTLSVGKKLKDTLKYNGKVVLIVPKGIKVQPEVILKMKMNVLLEAPVDPERMIKVLAKLLALKENLLLEKLHRLQAQERNTLKADLASENKGSAMLRSEVGRGKARAPSKYDRFIENVKIDKESTTFSKSEINKKRQELVKKSPTGKPTTSSTEDPMSEKELSGLKVEFVKALFKKNKE